MEDCRNCNSRIFRVVLFVVFSLTTIHLHGQRGFLEDDLAYLHEIIENANIRIKKNGTHNTKILYYWGPDSIYTVKLVIRENRHIVRVERDKEKILYSFVGKNKFRIKQKWFRYTGESSTTSKGINNVVIKAKHIKLKIVLIQGAYELIPLRIKRKESNSKQLENLKKKIPVLLNNVLLLMLEVPTSPSKK
ncbi:MAG: hypothetical protein JKY52_07545 [Flavobacteriales bacterium]|nr:hypothetical protein [Flavobacteriales bacterium]